MGFLNWILFSVIQMWKWRNRVSFHSCLIDNLNQKRWETSRFAFYCQPQSNNPTKFTSTERSEMIFYADFGSLGFKTSRKQCGVYGRHCWSCLGSWAENFQWDFYLTLETFYLPRLPSMKKNGRKLEYS